MLGIELHGRASASTVCDQLVPPVIAAVLASSTCDAGASIDDYVLRSGILDGLVDYGFKLDLAAATVSAIGGYDQLCTRHR